jgi:uncharacterized membrane protein YfcA
MIGVSRLPLVGFGVGFFSAGVGVGGGALLMPLLVSVFRFDFKRAAAISLATILPITCVGALSYAFWLPESPDLRYYLTFIPACVAGTMAGTGLVSKQQNRWMKFAFSLYLLTASVRMLRLMDFPALIFLSLDHFEWLNTWPVVVGAGFLAGMIAVNLGVGCGLLIVPCFVIMIDWPIHQAIVLSLTTMFFLSLSATLVQKKLRRLDMDSVKQLFVPALIGATLGVIVSSRLPATVLQKIFGLFLFAVTVCCDLRLFD